MRNRLQGAAWVLLWLLLVGCRATVVREERLTLPATMTAIPTTKMPTATEEPLVTATPRSATATSTASTPTDLPLVSTATPVGTPVVQLPATLVTPLAVEFAATPIAIASSTPVILLNTAQPAAPVLQPVQLTPFGGVPTSIPFNSTPMMMPPISNMQVTPLGSVPTSASFNSAPVVTPPINTSSNPNFSGGYVLIVAKHGEDSLFVVNASTRPFPLGALEMGGEGGEIDGSEWGIAFLQIGQCVTAWKDGGNPEPPDITCQQVGPEVIRDGPSRFWKSAFDIYYQNEHVSRCEGQQCVVNLND